MKAGRLNKRITIQTATEAQNTYGEPIKTWAEYVTAWASVEPLNGREYWSAKELNAEITIRFRMRYYDGVTPKMRVVYDSRNFDIESIINTNESNVELLLMCKENV